MKSNNFSTALTDGSSLWALSNFFSLLTNETREKVLIFDDSIYDRPRSNAVELLAWMF
jgi:hypothetical protein